MGDYGGYHNHVAAGELGYVANGGHDDWSWMHNPRPDNTSPGYVAKEEEHYYDGVDYEEEDSYTQVEGATTSTGYGHRRVHSFSGDHSDFLHSEPAKEKTKKKKKKNRQLERLQEPTDSYSDPGVGDGTSFDYSQRTDLVSSWLEDATLASQAPPEKPPPQRRHSHGSDMVVRSASLPNPNVEGHYETQDNQLALFEPASGINFYQPEEKSLGKALKLVRTKAAGLAENIKQKAIEVKKMAAPVVNPLINAMMEESRQQLSNVVLGPDGINGIFDQPGRGNSRGRRGGRGGVGRGGRGGTGRGGRGETGRGGRGGPMPRPTGGQPPMIGGVPLGPRPVMRPGIIPRPVMRPGMLPRPEMRPGMLPSPVIRPGMTPRPVIRPGMRPPSPGTMVARGQGAVALRGRARPVAPPNPIL